MSLADSFKAAAPQPKTPENWMPRVEIGPSGGIIVTKAEPVSENADPSAEPDSFKILKDHNLSPDQWRIVNYKTGIWGPEENKLTSKSLSIAPINGAVDNIVLPDLHDLEKSIAEIKRSKPPVAKKGNEEVSVVGVLADMQVGKLDEHGGIEELLERNSESLEAWKSYIKKIKPAEIILLDAGDSIENFQNTMAQAQTNDLPLTVQLRVWRRMLWNWVEAAASMAPSVTAATVSSNHTRVRKGKDYLSHPYDDYGIETLSQVEDMARVNPDKYGHVKFNSPSKFEESLAIHAVGGKIVGLVHGHQVTRQNMLGEWWAKQSHGRTQVGQADILVAGHFHNLRIETSGNDRWIFGAPTSDNGSSWYRNISGNASAPGVLTFSLDRTGWGDLTIC